MENTFGVANYFIKKAKSENIPLSPMKLIKLVYIANGWYWAFFNHSLIGEDIEAWKYGPVVSSIYHRVKSFGSQNIPTFQIDFDEEGDVYEPMVKNEITCSFLDKVWDSYKGFTALELSSLTHKAGTPWDTAWNKQGGNRKSSAIIENKTIEEYYKNLLNIENNLK